MKIFYLMMFTTLGLPLLAQLGQPYESDYPNPYELMFTDRYRGIEDGVSGGVEINPWYVYANQDHAPIYKQIPTSKNVQIKYRTKFLQAFVIHKKRGHHVQVKSTKGNLEGWMDMRHLIISPVSITNPKNKVRLKAFFRVKVIDGSTSVTDVDSLRFRTGPGQAVEGDNPEMFRYLNKTEDIPKVGDLVSYVFAVRFNPDMDQPERYRNIENHKDAAWFLIGDRITYKGPDFDSDQMVIRGWLPASGVVLWQTRQALERVPVQQPEAHYMDERSLLYQYFDLRTNLQRANFRMSHADRMVEDKGIQEKLSGQTLRPIIFGNERINHRLDLVSEHIGFSGSANLDMGILGEIQEGARFLDICILVDGTKSMEPCLEAAAKVGHLLHNKLKGENQPKIKLHAAVFRDETDKPKHYQHSRGHEVGSWLDNIQEYSGDDPDFEESLYMGIQRSVRDWRKQFSHPYSTRVLIILGDAGDNGRGPKVGDIEKLLKKYNIQPFAIRFDHEYTGTTNESHAKEKRAMKAFEIQLNNMFQTVYGQLYNVGNQFKVRTIGRQHLQSGIDHIINEQVGALSVVIGEIPNIRYGMRSFKEIICEKAFPKDAAKRQNCKNCDDKDALLKYLQNNAGEGSSAGLIMAGLKALEDKHPEIWNLILEKPSIAFQEAYVARRQQGTSYTRPVLLLGQSELKMLLIDFEENIHEMARCEEEKFREILVRALSMILGEAYSVRPNEVSRQTMKNWFDMAVDKDRSLLGNAEIIETSDIANRLCRNLELWKGFFESMTQGAKFLNNLLYFKNDSSRIYRDNGGIKYYWVYPEEILPPINVGATE